MGDNCKRQDIEYSEELTQTDLGFVECEIIPGIGSKKSKQATEGSWNWELHTTDRSV